MKISNMGNFCLVSVDSSSHALGDGANLVYVKDGRISVGIRLDNPDASFVVNFTDSKIILTRITGSISVYGKDVSQEVELIDNLEIQSAQVKMIIRFFSYETSIEEIIDIFMDGNLDIPLDMDSIFYEYAKRLKITDKKAISNVMAAIDIPEIEKL